MKVSDNPPSSIPSKNDFIHDLEYLPAYLDDLLILSSSMFENHLNKLGTMIWHFQNKGMPINAPESTFVTDKIDIHQQAFEYIKTVMAKMLYWYIQTFPKSL